MCAPTGCVLMTRQEEVQLALPSVLSSVEHYSDETRGVSGHVPLGAACTTVCFVECGCS